LREFRPQLEEKILLQTQGVAARDTGHEQHGLRHWWSMKRSVTLPRWFGSECWEW